MNHSMVSAIPSIDSINIVILRADDFNKWVIYPSGYSLREGDSYA